MSKEKKLKPIPTNSDEEPTTVYMEGPTAVDFDGPTFTDVGSTLKGGWEGDDEADTAVDPSTLRPIDPVETEPPEVWWQLPFKYWPLVTVKTS